MRALDGLRRVVRTGGLRFALLIAIAAGGFGLACKSDGQKVAESTAPQAMTGVVGIDVGGGKKALFRVELAVSEEEHQRGLMFRTHLDEDAGMLFLGRDPREQVFWMKNTLIPLDMIFIGTDRRIVGIVENAEPKTTSARTVGLPSLHVLEIGGGLSAKLGIRAGQAVEFHGFPVP
jgi:uncharacterized membrane protein (UPF0127 family)